MPTGAARHEPSATHRPPTDYPDVRPTRAALHEAGHVVVGHLCGLQVGRVQIDTSGNGSADCGLQADTSPTFHALVLCAGYAVEAVVNRLASSEWTMEGLDGERLYILAEQARPDLASRGLIDLAVCQWREQAQSLVGQVITGVQRLARVIEVERSISGGRAREVIGAATAGLPTEFKVITHY